MHEALEQKMNIKAKSTSSSHEAAVARRRAMSSMGKQAISSSTPERTRGGDRTRTQAAPAASSAPTSAVAAPARARVDSVVATPGSAARKASRARRAALSLSGRRAMTSNDRVRDGAARGEVPAKSAERKEGCGCGCGGNCKGNKSAEAKAPGTGQLSLSANPAARSNGNGARLRRNVNANKPTGRLLVLARRAAMSTRGKAASDTPTSAAGLARQANPRLSSRELAQKVREARSKNGSCGERKTQSAGKIRAERRKGGASDQPWKVGVSETTRGQAITGTKVSRSGKTTGDEQATCRTITGTEYMGAEIFREFCQADPAATTSDKVRVTATTHGNAVTGNEVGRSSKVTGDEPGTCKIVTGTEYLAAGHYDAYCGTKPAPTPAKVGQARTFGNQPVSGTQVGRSTKVTGDEHGAGVRPTGTQYTDAQSIRNGRIDKERSPQVPPKVGTSVTLAGETVTGTRVGRSTKVTGDEPGACRIITGDEYADLAQYQSFCGVTPEPEPAKVGKSMTGKRQIVSGTRTGRSAKVTGDEPGTCKAVTGTPYAGLEQASDWCDTGSRKEISARTRQLAGTPGPRMTGIQPSIGGVATGDSRGACENVSGTPYVGKDQFAEACGGRGAAPGDADFPQTLDADAPGQSFTVMSPAREAFQARKQRDTVTGTRYETGSQITGPFDMAVGKITGTEQFRFGAKRATQPELTVKEPEESAAPPRSRITGEGQSAGSKITGDDWDRGDRVTGTEGASARRRNPTRPGRMNVMPSVDSKRNEEVPAPVSRVTGSSGNTERGALITYSGGARG
jgi:hypothetical protein